MDGSMLIRTLSLDLLILLSVIYRYIYIYIHLIGVLRRIQEYFT